VRYTLAAAVVAASFVAFGATASGQSLSAGKTTGAGSVGPGSNPFSPFRVNVNAHAIGVGPTVAVGRFKFSNPDFSFTGSVDCYFQAGNTSEIAGRVVDSKGLELAGEGFYAAAFQDNGEGAGAPPDLLNFNAADGVPLFCGAAGSPSIPVEQGNIQVHSGP
jgi:hypothetical protein